MKALFSRFSNPENPPPNPWGGLLTGCAMVSVATAATVALIMMWASARPVNLIPLSDAVASVTQTVLHDNEVPRGSITHSEPAFQGNAAAIWHHHVIGANLPPAVPVDALVRSLRERLEPRRITVLDLSTGEAARDLQLLYGDVEVARVHLQGGRLEPERMRDYRQAAERIARQVERIVHERLPEEGQLAIMPPEDRADGSTLWQFTRFEAFVPDDALRREMQHAIAEAMLGREVTVESEERGEGSEQSLRLSYQRYPVVQLLLTSRPPRRLPEIQTPRMEAPEREVSVFDPTGPIEPAAAPPEASPEEQDNLDTATPLGPEPSARGRVALIIDDGGEEPGATEVILGLDRALTLAILPDTSSGTELAQRAAAMGFEIMLHMPMETENSGQNYPNSLMTGMTPSELSALIERASQQVPGAVGINNHTGGAFTADPVSVERLMAFLRTTSLYFVDSRTSPQSVAFETARAHGIPAAQRDVFLDNEPDFEYIEGRFNELLAIARDRGSAIGIAHFRPRTAEALAALLPRLEEEGLRLVPVSELLQ